MQDRFKKLLEEKQLTATRFATLIKVNASAMSHILNGRSKPSFDLMNQIVQVFPDINLNWLVSGKGDMYNALPNEVKYQVVQKNLLEEEKKEKAEEKKTEEVGNNLQSPLPEQEIVSAITSTPTQKKVKRIILFFEDGSFEDYAK
ncbi:MAG: helix-turn-helix transcriptional regulator [Odoribacter sp.]